MGLPPDTKKEMRVMKSQQVKGSKKELNSKVTVSIRNMDTKIWHKAGYYCKRNQLTYSEYIEQLIRKDLAPKRKKDTSKSS